MKLTVFIEEVVWERDSPATVSPDGLARMVTSDLERRMAGTGNAPVLPGGRTRLAGLAMESEQRADSSRQLGQEIARAIEYGLNEKNW